VRPITTSLTLSKAEASIHVIVFLSRESSEPEKKLTIGALLFPDDGRQETSGRPCAAIERASPTVRAGNTRCESNRPPARQRAPVALCLAGGRFAPEVPKCRTVDVGYGSADVTRPDARGGEAGNRSRQPPCPQTARPHPVPARWAKGLRRHSAGGRWQRYHAQGCSRW